LGSHELKGPPHNISMGRDSTDIFAVGKPLFQKAKEISAGLARLFPVRNGQAAYLAHDEQSHEREDQESQADAPVFAKEERDDASQKKQTGQDTQDELGKKVRKSGNIPIGALDEFARRMCVVKRH